MDLEKLFDEHTEIKFSYRGVEVIYTYRHPTSTEWLEYQRRASSFNVRKKKVAATEESTGARLWLHEKMRVKVEILSDGARREIEDKFPPLVKDQAVIGYLSQAEPADEDDSEKN